MKQNNANVNSSNTNNSNNSSSKLQEQRQLQKQLKTALEGNKNNGNTLSEQNVDNVVNNNTNNNVKTTNNVVHTEKNEVNNNITQEDLSVKYNFPNIPVETRCFQCDKSNLEFPLTFSCGHINCLQCLTKCLLLTQFKSIENQQTAIFSCKCHTGNIDIPYVDLISLQKQMNLPKHPGKCRKHKDNGIKYCMQCELWLCSVCLDIHSEFNSQHTLEDVEHPVHQVCNTHGEVTKFYCKMCKHEICPLCVVKGSEHYEHAFMNLDEFDIMTNEIKRKFQYKNINELGLRLDDIKREIENEHNDKVKYVNDSFDKIEHEIAIARETYNDIMKTSIAKAMLVIEVIRESFCNYYQELNMKEQDFYTLEYLNQVIEILNINAYYNTVDELSVIENSIKKFSKKEYFTYSINSKENPYQPQLAKYDNFKRTVSTLTKTKSIKKLNDIKYETSLKGFNESIYAMINLSSSNGVVVAEGNDLLLYEDITDKTKKEKVLKGHVNCVLCLLKLNDVCFVSGSKDGVVKFWNSETGECEYSDSTSFKFAINAMCAVSNDIIGVCSHNDIKIYNVTNKTVEYVLQGHSKSVACLILINPYTVLSCSFDHSIKMWDLNLKECSYTLFGHDQPVFVVLLLNDGRVASGSGSWDKSIKIWNIKEKYCEVTLFGHKREIRAMKQMKNGWLITASMDKTIKVWNLNKKVCLQTLVSHVDVIFCLCLIDKMKFISAGRDKEIIVWKCT